MTLKLKKLICLGLVAAMTVTCFSACKRTPSGGGSTGLEEMDTTTKMTLSYMYWDDDGGVLGKELAKSFTEKYPNITVEVIPTTTADVNQQISDMHAASNTPDAFWYVNEIDTPIYNAYWTDMTQYFENDPENDNIIKGIKEYKIGYFGTDYKWATPIKFFPQVAWVNKQFFEDNSLDMPNTEWTWEEFEDVIEKSTMGGANGRYGQKQSFGLTAAGGSYPVTWYPFAADDACIGEFGWDGSQYNMDNWADGLNLQRDYLAKNWLIDESGNMPFTNLPANLEAVYGEQVYAQDAGYVAIRADKWWCWHSFWNNPDQGFIANKVIFAPYIQPHLSTTEGKTNVCVYDMGGISQWTDHPREAYELLKYMTWGADGWLKKMELYSTYETDEMPNATLRTYQIDVPITLDEEVWEKFRALEWYPQEGDEYGREEYFTKFFDLVKEKYWAGLGATQIPGFSTWLDTAYHGEVLIETQVLYEGGDAHEMVDELEKTGLEYYNERHDQIMDYLKMIGK